MDSETKEAEAGWVERRLTQEEAEEFERLYELIQEEQQAQFEEQGMSSDVASYKSLVRGPIEYFHERYTTDTDNSEGDA